MAKNKPQAYQHDKKALLRPEAGGQQNFPRDKRKPPREYCYDSSLPPALQHDDTAARRQLEDCLAAIESASLDDEKSLRQARAAVGELRKLSPPFLEWTGKAERQDFSVPTLPLFVHERLSTEAILDTLERHKRDRTRTLDLFGEGDRSIGEKIAGAYEHSNGWQNRMILGDSLQVMNSLLEYEHLGGEVQMVYMDPPYGIRFGSNFQPFVRRRDVKDGDDDHLSREVEMVQAYRDTWELGVHSWLTYMRDRLLLAREMLTDSGSCFVQISDENVHLARCVMDEVFGVENFCKLISFRTTAGDTSYLLPNTGDYIVWYAKNIENVKYRKIFFGKSVGVGTGSMYTHVESSDGKTIRKLSEDEIENLDSIHDGWKIFRIADLKRSGYSKSATFEYEFESKKYYPGSNYQWKTNKAGLDRLKEKGWLYAPADTLCYKRYFNDFPISEFGNVWTDTQGATNKSYVVQTSEKVIQRCMLMTTDPGDLVLDPTCGSGTTAVVAEQWGRRWLTMDVSRVPLALARQRLLTKTYPYYELKNNKTPAGGFVYARKKNKKGEEVGGIVPHVTLKSIANNEPAAEEVLVDKPETAAGTVRITGPFCVEAVLPTPLSPDDPPQDLSAYPAANDDGDDEDKHIQRMIGVLRRSPVICLPKNQTLELKNPRPPAKSLHLHAEAECDGQPVAVVFGPANGAISERACVDAAKEAAAKNFRQLLVIAFAIEPAARKTLEVCDKLFTIPAVYAQASTDLVMSDLLKNMRASEIFSVCGLPDVVLQKSGETHDDGKTPLYQVTLRGLDVFDPGTMNTDSRKGDDVPCWMVDTDYDGQCFRAGQVFFPRTNAWENIKKALKGDFADSVWEHLAGDTSAPFVAGEQIAVKVIDDRGNELLVVKNIREAV